MLRLTAVGACAFELDHVMPNLEPGALEDPALIEAEIAVTDVDATTAVVAHDVVVVGPLGPLEPAAALAPVDAVDLAVALESVDDAVDRRVRGRRQLSYDALMQLA